MNLQNLSFDLDLGWNQYYNISIRRVEPAYAEGIVYTFVTQHILGTDITCTSDPGDRFIGYGIPILIVRILLSIQHSQIVVSIKEIGRIDNEVSNRPETLQPGLIEGTSD